MWVIGSVSLQSAGLGDFVSTLTLTDKTLVKHEPVHQREISCKPSVYDTVGGFIPANCRLRFYKLPLAAYWL